MSSQGPRKIGEGSIKEFLRKGGRELDVAINSGRAQIVPDSGGFWNPTHDQIQREKGLMKQQVAEPASPTQSVEMGDLYGNQPSQDMDMER